MTVAQYDKDGKILGIKEMPKQEKNKDMMSSISPFSRADDGGMFYSIDCFGEIKADKERGQCGIRKLHQAGNYCTDKSIMNQRALHETLDRLLWRFACENNAYDTGHRTYTSIYYKGNMEFAFLETEEAAYNSYFYPAEVAMEAVREIVIPFMKKHSDFVW